LFKPRDIEWGKHLNRPNWLVLSLLFPSFGQLFLFVELERCPRLGKDPGSVRTWLLMGLYLLLEILTVAYGPATLRSVVSNSLIVGVAGNRRGCWTLAGHLFRQAALLLPLCDLVRLELILPGK